MRLPNERWEKLGILCACALFSRCESWFPIPPQDTRFDSSSYYTNFDLICSHSYFLCAHNVRVRSLWSGRVMFYFHEAVGSLNGKVAQWAQNSSGTSYSCIISYVWMTIIVSSLHTQSVLHWCVSMGVCLQFILNFWKRSPDVGLFSSRMRIRRQGMFYGVVF